MKKNKILLIVPVLVIACCLVSCTYPAGEMQQPDVIQDTPASEYVPGEIIVKVSDLTPAGEIDALVPGTRVKTVTAFGGSRYFLYSLFAGRDPAAVLAALTVSGRVQYAEQNSVYTLCGYVPDDPFYSQYQYAPQVTQCEAGWEIEKGSSSITVAVLDTGINGEHEDLAGRVLAGRNVVSGVDIAASANSDDNGHGSHVAGIIGAMGGNGKGVAGVAWNVKLLPVIIFAPDIFTTTAHIAEALAWAVDHGADVVNMSFVGEVFSMAVNDAVNYALQNNVVLVAATGNDLKSKIMYPSALPGVIAVGATGGRDEIAYFSTRGSHISVTAPGVSIYSCSNISNTHYHYGSGTSMAAPFVAGLAALLLSHNSLLEPAEVRSMIEDSADPLGEPGFDPVYGYGRVNVYKALTIPVRNNYQSITVDVSNRGIPLGGAKVLLEDTATAAIILSGLTSYGGTAGGIAGRLVFNGIRPGNYQVRVQVGAALTIPVTLTPGGGNQQTSFAFNTPVVLIVNGIKETDISLLTDEFYYAQELTKMGRYYTMWKSIYNGPPSVQLLESYDMVIWYTGKTRDDPEENIEVLTPQETTVIRDYLDAGGRLYLCGNNIAEHLAAADPGFLENYLHAELIAPSLVSEELTGSGLLGNMYVLLYVEDDDRIAVKPGADGILDANESEVGYDWAGLSYTGAYDLVFTTICPNEILYCNPEDFFARIINWLDAAN